MYFMVSPPKLGLYSPSEWRDALYGESLKGLCSPSEWRHALCVHVSDVHKATAKKLPLPS